MRRTTAVALMVLASTIACGAGDEPVDGASQQGSSNDLAGRLLGSWEGQNDTRGSMSFTFSADQTATWVVQLPSGPETMNLSYAAAARDGRLCIDLSGFETGPLVGFVMYGLVEFVDEDTLRMDLEPGPPGNDDPRSIALTSQDVITLMRTAAD